MIDKHDNYKIIEYMNHITDKNSPIFKTIGYYLNDQECVEELKDYFNSRLVLFGLFAIVIANVLLIGEIIFIISSYYHILAKLLLILIFILIDYILIKIYKNFMSLSYSYRIIYHSIQNVPKDILKTVYNRIMKKDLYD